MATLVVLCLSIIAFILTLWLVIIPAGVLAGTLASLGRRGRDWKWLGKYHHPHPS